MRSMLLGTISVLLLYIITSKSLLKAMAEEGLIQPGASQNTRPLRVGDKQKRVVYLYREKAEHIRDAAS